MGTVHVLRLPTGDHGIARYATEIESRLSARHPRIHNRGFASRKELLNLSSRDFLYSATYQVAGTAAHQLLTVHDLIHLTHPPRRPHIVYKSYYDVLLRPTIQRTGHVFTVSEFSRTALLEYLNNPNVQVHNTSNGCADQFFLHESKALPDVAPYFLFFANDRPHKNLAVLLKALAQVPRTRLIGVGSPSTPLQKAAKHYALTGRISFVRDADDAALASLYRGALALLFPSKMEGFGLPIVEAAASNCPVIYSMECAAAREICGKTGWAIPADDADAWSDAIRLRLGGSTPDTPNVSHFRWSSVARRVQETLDALAE